MKSRISSRRKTLIRNFFLLSLVLFSNRASAQELTYFDTALTYEISTINGAYLTGKVIEQTPEFIMVRKKTGLEIKIPRESIRVSKAFSGLPSGFDESNPRPSRYLYAPSAIPLKRGEGYLNLIYFLLFQAQYGITDNFSLGITTTPAFQPSFLNAKYAQKIKDKWSVSAGFQIGQLSFDDPEKIGILFANATYGDRESNISLNLGYGFYTETNENLPIIEVSGLFKSTNKVSLVGEIWVLLHKNMRPTIVGGPALRFQTSKKYFVDFGVLSINISESNYVPDLQTGNLRNEPEYISYWPIPFVSLGWTL